MIRYFVWDRIHCVWRAVVTSLSVWKSIPRAGLRLACRGVPLALLALAPPVPPPVPFVPLAGELPREAAEACCAPPESGIWFPNDNGGSDVGFGPGFAAHGPLGLATPGGFPNQAVGGPSGGYGGMHEGGGGNAQASFPPPDLTPALAPNEAPHGETQPPLPPTGGTRGVPEPVAAWLAWCAGIAAAGALRGRRGRDR